MPASGPPSGVLRLTAFCPPLGQGVRRPPEDTHDLESLLVLFCVISAVVFCVVGAWLVEAADASPLEVSVPSGETVRATGAEFVASETAATQVYLQCATTKTEVGAGGSAVSVAGKTVAYYQTKETTATHASEWSLSFLVGAGQKWKWEHFGTVPVVCESVYQTFAGGEGLEGKEGKEGKEGPPGAKGEAGATGAGGASKVDSFGTDATSELDGDAEAIHNDAWYLIGTMLACMGLYLLYQETRMRG
jgi:hypothetical protein